MHIGATRMYTYALRWQMWLKVGYSLHSHLPFQKKKERKKRNENEMCVLVWKTEVGSVDWSNVEKSSAHL